MAEPVAVAGRGRLYQAIVAALGSRVTPVTELATGGGSLLISAADGWDTSGHPAMRAAARQAGAGWLPVRTELSHAVIGPRELPGEPGCADCADIRQRRARPDPVAHQAIWSRYGDQLASRPPARLTGLAAKLVGAMVADEAATARPRTRCALLRVDLATLAVSRHQFLPEPTCPVCGGLPDDHPGAARFPLARRPAYRPGSYRTRDIGAELPALTARYFDHQVGVIGSIQEGRLGSQPLAEAAVGLRNGGTERGYGRASTAAASRLTAILEALERFGGAPGGRRTAVVASYRELAGQALDPRTLGLHPARAYRRPGFHLRQWTVDEPYRWVWGWSFGQRQPILVPELCAYYGAPHDPTGGHGFVYEISNGCALGGGPEEAILHGILEVAERDAFLLTWYARLPAPRLDLATARDPQPRVLAAALAADSGYRVRLFDITLEQAIPCVWAMAVNPDPADGRPARVCAAGSHPVPEQAARNALAELAAGLPAMINSYAQPGAPDRAYAMAADPDLVRSMADHSLLYGHPAAADRLDFLLDSPGRRAFDQVGEVGGFASLDLFDNLHEAVARYTRHGMDVVVVDQSAAEHRASDLWCVKVLIPGTLSMTFGHQYRRTTGLPRLRRVPQLLGYRDRPLRAAEVNPHPHPFP